MKLSCTPISFQQAFTAGQMALPQFIDTCAAMGCGAIDLLTTHQYPWLWKNPRAQISQVEGWLRQAGVTLAAHGCGNNFALADPAARQAQIELVHAGIAEAAELGAPVVRLFGGKIEPDRQQHGMGAHVGLPLVLEGIERCLPVAERHGVVLALENHGNLPGHAYEIQRIMEHFDSPHLRCTFDMANFLGHTMDETEDPLRAVDRLLPWIRHVHVKDVGPPAPGSAYRVEAYVAGEGVVPIRQVVACIEASGYDGWYSLEYEAAYKVPEHEGVARSLAYLTQVAQVHRTLARPAARQSA